MFLFSHRHSHQVVLLVLWSCKSNYNVSKLSNREYFYYFVFVFLFSCVCVFCAQRWISISEEFKFQCWNIFFLMIEWLILCITGDKPLDHEANLKLVPIHIVTDASQLPAEFLEPSPENQLVIGFDCEGVDLCRHGTLCIMQVKRICFTV